MCGIFRFVAAPGVSLSSADAQRAVRSLIRRSEPRGREATGGAVILPTSPMLPIVPV
jgi:hypothetical protein